MKMKMKMKIILVTSIVFLVCVCFAIISGLTQPKQELVVAFGQIIHTLDPHNNHSIQDILASDVIYEPLVKYDRDRNIIPVLATSWRQIDDLTWEFKIREGVKFHSGNPLDAEAVKYSIERCSKTGPGGGYVGMVDHCEVVDEYTVTVHLKYPFGPIVHHLGSAVVAIMDPAFIEEKGADIGQFASGTGAYKLKEFVPGSHVTYIKNEDYWGKKANIETVIWRVIPEASTRVLGLKNGELDLIENPPPHEIPGLESDKNFKVIISPKNRTLFFGFNMKDPVVGGEKNKPLRQAIALSINRQEIADYVLEGLATPANKGIMPIAVIGEFEDPSINWEYNPEKAKQLLKDANVPPGTTIEFLVTRGRYLLDTEIGEVIQEQISKLGLNVKLQPMEYASLAALLKEYKHQMYQLAWGCMTGEPTAPYFQLFETTSMSNFSGWGNEETDKILYDAMATVDWGERMRLYEKLYKKVFDDVSMVPIVLYQNIYAATNKLQNVYVSNEELVDIKNMYFE